MTVSSETLSSIGAPEQLETRLGTLDFVDGVPSGEAAEKVYDHLDFVHALNVYLDGFAGASTYAIRKGFHEAGVEDNQILIFSELMGSESVFLTANADTVYFLGVVDLTSGPMVVETPPQALGVIDDMWWGWIIDFGLPGPDRGEGGRFLLVPPGYDGPLPDSGYHVGHSRTSRALVLGRSFLTNDDPAPTVETIKSTMKLYPYAPGGAGTSVATLLEGGAPPAAAAEVPETVFVEGSGKAFNTVPPSDFGFFELMNEVVQDEPAGSTNAELHGAAGRDRDRQGPAVRARRADATASSRMRPPSATRPRGRCSSTSERPKASRTTTTTRRGSTCCGSAGTRSRRRRRWSRRRGSSRSPRPASGSCTPGRRSSTPPPGSRPRCACGSPGSGRSTSWPSRTPTGTPSTARRPTR